MSMMSNHASVDKEAWDLSARRAVRISHGPWLMSYLSVVYDASDF
jgi:hypothetical protein